MLINIWNHFVSIKITVHEKWPNTQVFLVRIFPDSAAFGLNTERYCVSLRIQYEFGKIRARKTSVFGHFSRSVTQDIFTGCDQLIRIVQISNICVLTLSQFTQSRELKQPYRDVPWRSCSQTQRCSAEQFLFFFPANVTRNYLFQNLFWLILQALGM